MAMTPVGITALWMAANRALESERADPLFTDPFARTLAGESGFATFAAVRKDAGNVFLGNPQQSQPVLSLRTRFFDDALLAVTGAASINQVVLLAAGLDTRAFRLHWPHDTRLYEIDRDDVLDYKESLLAQMAPTATCERRIIRTDLTQAWDRSLLAAGFDPRSPCAFLVEGLLMYLDESAAECLLKMISHVASPGSWLGLDLINTDWFTYPYCAAYLEALRKTGCPWLFGIDNPESWLASQGWHARVVEPGEPEANHGRWPFPVRHRSVSGIPRTFFVVADRTAPE